MTALDWFNSLSPESKLFLIGDICIFAFWVIRFVDRPLGGDE